MRIFVVFGSRSDEPVFAPLVTALEKDFDVEFAVISAHRDLEKLQKTIGGWKGDALVAGAGLAAALPGVVAAMTPLPVFGVPVEAQFAGLDSLCSIAQMPPGVPVLTCGPGKSAEIAAFLRRYDENAGANLGHIHFVMQNPDYLAHPDLLAEVEKAKTPAADKGAAVSLSDKPVADAVNVYMVSRAEDVQAGAFGLHVPFMPKETTKKPEAYLSVLDWTRRGGIWLGVNNTRNAVQGALRLRALAAQRLKGAA
jgi:5-(carboxyamino)imidazole ribonucleotide mutase